MHAASRGRAGRVVSGLFPAAVALLLVGGICAARGGDVVAALASCPPWALAGATLAHLLTLVLRTETWRTVLLAAGSKRLGFRTLHAANAGSFVVGTLQSQAAIPARIALLRRFGGDDAPPISQIAVADAPIFLLEVCTSALLAAVAATAVPAIPAWAPALLMVIALAALCGLRVAHARFQHRALAKGLAVLAKPRPRTRLIALVLALTGAALLRTWLVLLGFGLPGGPTDVALVLFSMGAIGLLPLGAVGTAPTATVAAMGAANLTAAAAAGVVIGTSTVLAVLIYAAACWAAGARFIDPVAEEPEPAESVVIPLRPYAEAKAELDLAA